MKKIIAVLAVAALFISMHSAGAKTSVVLTKGETSSFENMMSKDYALSSGTINAYASPGHTGLVKVNNKEMDIYGSGFLIDKDTVITASHVVLNKNVPAKAQNIELYISRNGANYRHFSKASKVIRLLGGEVSVIKLKSPVADPFVRPMKIAPNALLASLKKDKPLVVTGYPYTKENPGYQKSFRTAGYLINKRPDTLKPSQIDIFFTHMIARPGFSGGPLRDAAGNVYGIHTMGEAPLALSLVRADYFEWGGGLLITKDIRRLVRSYTTQNID